MRFATTTARVLATGALLFAVPAAASASTSSAGPAGSANTASATYSQFAMVADGQTVAQVDQEMGGAGTLDTDGVFMKDGISTESFTWNDSTLGPLGGLLRFSIDFSGPAGQPLIVSGKTALGLTL